MPAVVKDSTTMKVPSRTVPVPSSAVTPPLLLPESPQTLQGAPKGRSVDTKSNVSPGIPDQWQRDAVFLQAQNSIMLQEIDRLKRVNAGQARRIEELQAAISQRDATELQEDCSNGASVVHHAGADVPGPAQRPLLNDAMAVKTSLDNNMLRPLLSNARAHSCSAADAPGTPEKTAQFVTNAASPVAIPSELSSFLIRSQEKRRHFSSSLKQLMRSASTEHEGACGELLEKQITIERGEGGLLGLRISRQFPSNQDDHVFVITAIAPGGAAAASDELQVGDHVVKIDGNCLDDLSVEDIRSLLRGPHRAQITFTTVPAKLSQKSQSEASRENASRASGGVDVGDSLVPSAASARVASKSPLTPKAHRFKAPMPPQSVQNEEKSAQCTNTRPQSFGSQGCAVAPFVSASPVQASTDHELSCQAFLGPEGIESEFESAPRSEIYVLAGKDHGLLDKDVGRLESARSNGETSEFPSETAQNHPASAKLVPSSPTVILALCTNEKEAGEEGSTRRAVFNIKLAGDLARATGIYSRFFSINPLHFGSKPTDDSARVRIDITVDEGGAHDPKAVVEQLLSQFEDPNSILSKGEVTSKVTGVFDCKGPNDLERECQAAETPILESAIHEFARSPCEIATTHQGMENSFSDHECRPDNPKSHEIVGTIGTLQSTLAAREAEYAQEKQREGHKFEEALAVLEQRMETKYTQLIWRQMQAHEKVVQDLLSRIRDSDNSLST